MEVEAEPVLAEPITARPMPTVAKPRAWPAPSRPTMAAKIRVRSERSRSRSRKPVAKGTVIKAFRKDYEPLDADEFYEKK